MKYSSTPISNGGTSFKTHDVVFDGDGNMIIRPTIRNIVVGVITFIVLYGLFGYMMVSGLRVAILSEHVGFGILLLLSGGVLALGFSKFNILSEYIFKFEKAKNIGCCYSYWSRRKPIWSKKTSEVVAIQVLKKTVKTHNTNQFVAFTSFEVNLVNNDYSRSNLLDYGKENNIIYDAQLIADFLQVPLERSNA